jgi:hypothetical protein
VTVRRGPRTGLPARPASSSQLEFPRRSSSDGPCPRIIGTMSSSAWIGRCTTDGEEDVGLGRADEATGSRMGIPEAGRRPKPNPGGSGHEDGGCGRKTAAPEERWRLRKQDGAPDRKTSVREARISVREERRRLGTPKKRPSKKDGRSGSWKNGRERKSAVRIAKKRSGREKRLRGTGKTGFCASAGGGMVPYRPGLKSRVARRSLSQSAHAAELPKLEGKGEVPP